ncbi:unnamed protein product [Protopolystoma xenopodis]|uniref:Uncharacterized protein n=1 Tax=Protopolystoma xenopodis TaxID=117903 RepID=A0A3S5BU21_9PLAT|nr:unnamed protein product [Protopolystoma xenopodis]
MPVMTDECFNRIQRSQNEHQQGRSGMGKNRKEPVFSAEKKGPSSASELDSNIVPDASGTNKNIARHKLLSSY